MNILATSTINGITYHLIDQFTPGHLIDPAHVYATLNANTACITSESCRNCAVDDFCSSNKPVSSILHVFPTLAETNPELFI